MDDEVKNWLELNNYVTIRNTDDNDLFKLHINYNRLIENKLYIAGYSIKQIPANSFDYRIAHKSEISERTLGRLYELQKLYNITWDQEYLTYNINRGGNSNIKLPKEENSLKYVAKGYIFHGNISCKKYLKHDLIPHLRSITYFRRETKSSMAGQSFVYFLNGKRIQATIALGTECISSTISNVMAWHGLINYLTGESCNDIWDRS